MVASEVSEKGLAWHEELKTDVVTDGEAPTWHLRDETSANESFGRWKGKRVVGVLFFFLGGGKVLLGMELLSLPQNGVVLCHTFFAMDCFWFSLGAAIEKNVEMS